MNRDKANINLEHGKLPAQNIEIEEAVLGALLIDKTGMYIAKNILTEQTFYKEQNQLIYSAIKQLDDKSQPIDLITIVDKLKKLGKLEVVGGPYYISQLTDRVSSAANIESHCMIIKQHEIKRKQVAFGAEIITQGYDPTCDIMQTNEMISKTANELMNTIEPNSQRNNVELIRLATKHVERAAENKGITGVQTGFVEHDKMTGGWQPGDIIIIAARPSMGKTAFILSMARNMSYKFNNHVAFFSLEMKGERLMSRLISGEAQIPNDKLKKGKLTTDEWKIYHKGAAELEGEELHIFDDVKSIHGIKTKCLELHMKGKLDCVVIDYLQLIEYQEFKNNREREVSEISRSLKLLAMQLNIPIICLSQLSREVEKRASKKPQLSDLRDSGSIEQDADVVEFLFRPSYYKMLDSPENLALGMIRKNRDGALGTIKLNFISEFVQFTDWEEGKENDGLDF